MTYLLAVALALAALCCLLGASLAAADGPPPPVPVPVAPVNTAAPTLTGTPALGQTLTCSTGSWANNPTSFSYTWLRSGVAIPGQSASTYVVQAADQGHAISCQVTASNGGGNYTISGLPSESYKVEFFTVGSEGGNYLSQYYNGKTKSGEATPVAVTLPNATGEIDAELHAGGQIVGRAVDSVTQAPLPNIFVCAEDEVGGKDEYGNCEDTNSNGEYTISDLPTGSYTVSFEDFFSEGDYATQYYNGKSSVKEAQQVAVTAGAAATGINAEMVSLDEQGQITGTVTKASGGQAIPGIEVCAYATEGEYPGGCAQTNANGEYDITGLAATHYAVSFFAEWCFSSGCAQSNYAPQYFDDKLSGTEATPVSVAKGTTTPNIDAKMIEGGRITGTVTKATGGGAISGIEVCAESVSTVYDSGCAFTNSVGEYTIQALSTAEYDVTFYGTGGYLTQYYDGKSQYSESTPVSVKDQGATTPNIDAKMIEGGQITGRVTAASTHAALAEIEVCADSSGNEYEGCATTNADGEYAILGLPTSTYQVTFYVVYNSGSNYLTQSENDVSVTMGSVTPNINAELHPGGQITGRVTDAVTHLGLSKIEVCAYGITVEFESCAETAAAPASSASAKSATLTVPAGNFTQAKPPSFNSKTGDLDFFLTFPTAGTLKWSLFFRNADVGFADSLGISLGAKDSALAEVAKKKGKAKAKPKKCKKTQTKHKGKCVATLVSFASGSQSVPAGTVEVKVHANSKALKALKAGRTLHVSGTFTFQSALGGPPVAHTVSTVVHLKKKTSKAKKHGKGKKR